MLKYNNRQIHCIITDSIIERSSIKTQTTNTLSIQNLSILMLKNIQHYNIYIRCILFLKLRTLYKRL